MNGAGKVGEEADSQGNRTLRRMRRILAIASFLAARPGVLVSDVCRHFSLDRHAFFDDLGLLFLCGLPPYAPGDLFEVEIREDRVWLFGVKPLTRSSGISREEALRSLLSARMALAFADFSDALELTSAAEKLSDVLGAANLAVAAHRVDDRLDLLQAAVRGRQVLNVRYWSYSRDVEQEREVEPGRLFMEQGVWYLDVWCRLANGLRTLRVDRMRDFRHTGERFVEDRQWEEFGYRSVGDHLQTVLLFPPGSGWVAEKYPFDECDYLGDGRLRIVLSVPHEMRLVSLLCQIGPDAEVLAPLYLDRAWRERAQVTRALYDAVREDKTSED